MSADVINLFPEERSEDASDEYLLELAQSVPADRRLLVAFNSLWLALAPKRTHMTRANRNCVLVAGFLALMWVEAHDDKDD